MSNVRKTLQMTSLLFGMVILFSYIGWHLGYEGFIIVGNIEMPYFISRLLASILLLINLSFYGGFIIQEYRWDILKYSIPVTLISAIGSIWFPAEIFTGPLPAIIFLIISLKRKQWISFAIFNKKVTIQRAWLVPLIEFIILIHQGIVSKITSTPLTAYVSVYTALRLSIDSILLMLLFYSLGGVKYYGHRLESLVFPGRTRDDRSRNDGCQAHSQSSEDLPVGKFEKWLMRSVIGVVQILQWIFILWICNLDNLFLDALVMTTSFICHGMIISKRKHLKPIVICTFAATAIFYTAARFTISFQYSQLFSIVVGLILVYTMYRISYQFEMSAKKKAKEELARLEALEQQVANAWQQLDELS